MVLLGFWARLSALVLLGFPIIATLFARGTRGLTGRRYTELHQQAPQHRVLTFGVNYIPEPGDVTPSVD
jgi:uncharacterized membrane protein YphA (DoxX/SURF4 family)